MRLRRYCQELHLTDPAPDETVPAPAAGEPPPVRHLPDSFFRELLNAAPDAMIVTDPSGRMIIVNAEAEKMFGYSRERMLGAPIEMLMPERYRLRHVQHRSAYTEAPKLHAMGIGMQLAGLRSDGTEFPIEVSLSPIVSGNRAFVASSIRDVTKRQQIEEALTAAREIAQRARKANSAFLAAASHDLRQPVQALGLLAGALRRTVQEPLALEMVENLQESLDGMTSLLNSLLDISRLDAGIFEPSTEEFPVQRLLDRLSSELARQARQKGLGFEVASNETLIRSDPHLLGEIIQNFVSNAIRYTEQGSIRLTCKEQESDVSITVTDTGIGIAADQLENIFKEFHQVRHPSRKREGFGLGLAIARRLADLLDHRVSVESTPGRGSSFSIRVPRAYAQAGQAAVHEKRTQTRAPAGELVVLIEDDVKVAKAWELLLRAEGYRVAVAESAADARHLAQSLPDVPSLIIADYHLADGSNGVDATRIVREVLHASVPAFLVTADTSRVLRDLDSLENSRSMSKPISPEVLLRLAREAIDTGRA